MAKTPDVETERAADDAAATAAPAERQAAPEAPRPKGIGVLGWLRWGWRQLTTMRTALILLFLVALGAVPGSMLPQRGQAPEKVAEYFEKHKTLAPVLDKLSLFDVFSAPWFAAIYILLFVSLAGCVLPRAVVHYKSMRARPPKAPRNFTRLPQSARYETDAPPEEVLAEARRVLRGRRFRVDVADGSVASEKGYLGETGNLVFHLALLGLLFALATGNLFGYRGDILLTEGKTFANQLSNYDQFKPGSQFDTGELAPFSLTLERFKATYALEGANKGQATDYNATMKVQEKPGGPVTTHQLKVNHPIEVGGAKVYLLNHGDSPVFTVRDAKGNVAFRDAVPFLPMETVNYQSEGVIKAPDAQPDQLAFYAIFWPTAVATENGKDIRSGWPDPLKPYVSLMSFKGDIGLDKGDPQSVYRLDGIGKTLHPVKDGKAVIKPGETMTLPNGAGSITFDGIKQWTSLSVNHDPGRMPALIASILAVAGVIASFMVRRRRVWVRAAAGPDGRTVVEVGGLTLGHPTAEFDDIVTALRGETSEDEAAEDEASEHEAAEHEDAENDDDSEHEGTRGPDGSGAGKTAPDTESKE